MKEERSRTMNGVRNERPQSLNVSGSNYYSLRSMTYKGSDSEYQCYFFVPSIPFLLLEKSSGGTKLQQGLYHSLNCRKTKFIWTFT